jgi:hypothetical protein
MAFRTVAGVGILLMSIVLLSAIESKRTQSEMGAILSALLLDQGLNNVQDWSAGRQIQITLQRESAGPLANWTGGGLLFGQGVSFAQSARTSRASFLLSNVFSRDIQTELHLPSGVQSIFISRREFERNNRRDFQARSPNNFGYFVVSSAGLNLSKNEALLYTEHLCGPMCGSGSYVLMRKVDGVWHVVDRHRTWMS